MNYCINENDWIQHSCGCNYDVDYDELYHAYEMGYITEDELYHFGVQGMKWGVRHDERSGNVKKTYITKSFEKQNERRISRLEKKNNKINNKLEKNYKISDNVDIKIENPNISKKKANKLIKKGYKADKQIDTLRDKSSIINNNMSLVKSYQKELQKTGREAVMKYEDVFHTLNEKNSKKLRDAGIREIKKLRGYSRTYTFYNGQSWSTYTNYYTMTKDQWNSNKRIQGISKKERDRYDKIIEKKVNKLKSKNKM